MSKLPIIDMHCHILPGIDDGCKDVTMANAMLQQASEAGVTTMVCTPHYYPKESISDFLAKRSVAIAQLQAVAAAAEFRCPSFYYGAEVYYFSGIAEQPDLSALCINGTRYLLLELPFSTWDRNVLRDIQRIQSQHGLRVIIAHLERYLKLAGKSNINELLDMNVLVQMNAGYLLNWKTAGKAKKMLKNEIVQLLGSDTHHPETRPQTMGEAYELLLDSKYRDLAIDVSRRSARILGLD